MKLIVWRTIKDDVVFSDEIPYVIEYTIEGSFIRIKRSTPGMKNVEVIYSACNITKIEVEYEDYE